MITSCEVPLEVYLREGAAPLDDVVQRINADNRVPAEKLAGARENARFTDRRLSDLEVQHVASIDPTRRAPSEPP